MQTGYCKLVGSQAQTAAGLRAKQAEEKKLQRQLLKAKAHKDRLALSQLVADVGEQAAICTLVPD